MFLRPNYNIESIYDIDVAELKSIGIKALFFDLDSTLMKSKSGKFSFRTLQFLQDLKSNFRLAIVTNNKNVKYIKQVKSPTDIPVYHCAKKPNVEVLLKACKDLELCSQDVVMIGDRPLSDILGGINAGMMTILVDSISKNLYTAEFGEPDLIIRTGGEYRLSNFLLYQGAYSELYFTPVLWPDFDQVELDKALDSFAQRKRRFGKV